MRKRIVIAAIAVLVVGVAVFLLSLFSGPDRGSVEWHQRKYLEAQNGNAVMFLRSVWSRVTGGNFYTANYRYRSEGMQSNRTALIRLGYLAERTFVISNRPVREVVSNAWFNVPTNVNFDFIRVQTWRGTNLIEVSTVSGDIPKWEEAIRQADVPETTK